MARSEYEKVGQADNAEPFNVGGDSDDEETLPGISDDVRRHDVKTLGAEEEAEKLLGVPAGSTRSASGRGDGYRRERRSKRRREGEKRELMHEMEEGGPRSSSADSSEPSSEVDMVRSAETQGRGKSKTSRFGKFAAIQIFIVVAFLALLYGAYRASHTKQQQHESTPEPDDPKQTEHLPPSSYKPQTLSNGTHTFLPTTILISLDGFRADFLHRNLTPHLSSLLQQGASAPYMHPSFPSLTFPNHFTLVTGLHPESHGIVGNNFFDPNMSSGEFKGQGRHFTYADPEHSMQPEWWQAEPLWETAELQGVRSAIHMWPGSEAGIGGVEPGFVDGFKQHEELGRKVERVLGWLDLPGSADAQAGAMRVGKEVQGEGRRPQFIAAYVPDVDADGHEYGPNSTYIRSTITEVDSMLGLLLTGLSERNLTSIVNLIIVSDHGMATTSTTRLIQLEDILDTSLIEHTDGWPLYGLRPYNSSEEKLNELYEELTAHAESWRFEGAFDVYRRDYDMPERYHFTENERIAPLWIVPKPGWAVVTKEEFDVSAESEKGGVYAPRGLHGYDNEHPLMRAIFVATGPAFAHTPGSRLEAFQNIEVYNIVCDSLGIEPVRNNGTLRLPLETSGVHGDEEVLDLPLDLQDDESLALPPEVPNLAFRPDFGVPTESVPAVVSMAFTKSAKEKPSTPPAEPSDTILPSPDEEGAAAGSRPVVHDDAENKDKEGDGEGGDAGGSKSKWWNWVTGKLEVMKGWAGTFFGGSKKGGGGGAAEADASTRK